jgi:RNA polymerase sigma-70 factor (ECF subfamily)
MSKTCENNDTHAETPVGDSVLVQRSREGDLKAFDELVSRYKDRIYRITYQMTSNHEDANDLAQEAFIRAFRSIGKFRGQSSFYTWIYRIAVNLTLNFLKKAGKRKNFSLDDTESSIHRDPVLVDLFHDETPARGAGINELRQKIHAALQELTPNHRAVVVMHDIENMTHGQIAKILGINEGTVRSRLFYARRELQALLSEYQ